MRTFSNIFRCLPVLALMALFVAACDDSPTAPIGDGFEFGDSGGSGAAPVASVLISRNEIDVTAALEKVAAADVHLIHTKAFDLPEQEQKIVITTKGIVALGEVIAKSYLRAR